MNIHKHDIVNFISKLSFTRIANIVLLVLSHYASSLFKREIQLGHPMTISIEPTTACNLRCPECPSGLRSFSRDTGNLKSNFFKEIIDQLYKKLTYLIFYFQGEPYINPDFLDMVSYANDKNLYTITSTNGHFLNEKNSNKTVLSGLDRIIISLDGVTQETYELYRKEGKIDNVIAGIKNLVKAKEALKSKTPHIVIQFLVVRHNEHEIDELYKLADSLGVDEVKLKSAQVYNYKYGNDLIPTIKKYSRYKKLQDGTFGVKHLIKDHCWKLWHAAVITWDGKVVPCCFDKDAKHVLGDLKKSSFKKIWNGKPYKAFRTKILKSRKSIDICSNCSEGCSVFY